MKQFTDIAMDHCGRNGVCRAVRGWIFPVKRGDVAGDG